MVVFTFEVILPRLVVKLSYHGCSEASSGLQVCCQLILNSCFGLVWVVYWLKASTVRFSGDEDVARKFFLKPHSY